MNVVIAIDSFKGSLSSLEAGESAANGIKKVYPDATTVIRPLADGGEGTVDALVAGCGGKMTTVSVTGPLGETVSCQYGIVSATKTAIIEMAVAAGITLVPPQKKNPLHTTTYGVGEIIADAVKRGCRHFLIGIGGSATNDGGIGMLQALGYEFRDNNGQPVPFGANGLSKIATIHDTHVLPDLKDCHFKIACDVTNPLCGPQGCSAIFGTQKGATPDMIRQMDQWLATYANITREKYPNADPDHPGTGAAGGLGFAFLSYTNAILQSGIQIILEETRLESCIKDADIVITGEGRLDGQTIMGKAPIGVAAIAKKYNKTVLAFSGCTTPEASLCNQHGIDAFFPILHTITTLEEAMTPETTRQNLTDTTEQVFRLIQAVQIH